MSELSETRAYGAKLRHALMVNVSILALLGAVDTSGQVSASPAGDGPNVWIELGGQLEHVDRSQSVFAPAFFDLAAPSVANAMIDAQRPSRFSVGGDGRITILPSETGWQFSVQARYGQVKNSRHLHYETPGLPAFYRSVNGVPGIKIVPQFKALGDGQVSSAESHLIVDFQAGKDIGLGLLGGKAVTNIEIGIRFAQFTARTEDNLHARPIDGYGPAVRVKQGANYITRPFPYRQTNYATQDSSRSTHAIGPSVAWNGSIPVLHERQDMAVLFDWGVNGAILFGRQKMHEEHKTTGKTLHYNLNVKATGAYATSGSHNRERSLIIPNVGGFAGISMKFPNAKVSLGYRGDFFFKATDVGIDARETENRNFFGPFATISIGLGG